MSGDDLRNLVVVNADDQLHGSTAHVAILDVMLMVDRTVDRHINRVATIRALYRYCAKQIHDGLTKLSRLCSTGFSLEQNAQRNQCKNNEPDQRPLGNTQPEKAPIDFGTIAIAFE